MQIGIDLGTTFSVAAYKNDRGEIGVILNREGKRTTPSVVLFAEDGSAVVGEVAKENILLQEENVISHVKDHMGTNKKFRVGHKSYSAEEVSALILKKIVKDASDRFNVTIKDVVITIPAYFTDAQRIATKDAAKLSGIHVLGLINEPTAAAVCFAAQAHLEKATILVYDLGGGTFDVSIVEVSANSSRTIATGGIRKMGGHFFDQLIVNDVTDYLEEKHSIDLYDDDYADDLQELILKAENAKIQLSSLEQTDIIMKIGKIKEKITIYRSDFERKIYKFYKRTESTINMVLKDAGMIFDDIDKILLVGGSSKIPLIRNKISEISGIEPSIDIHPDESVAMGAAIYAKQLSQKENKEIAIKDVCSHSLGIVSLSSNNKRINSILIKRNSQIPIEVTRTFYLSTSNQRTIQLELTEGEEEDLEYVNILTRFTLHLPAGLKEKTPVNVSFRLDSDQILHIFVKISGAITFEEECVFERLSNMTEQELSMSEALISDIEVF